MNVHKWMVTIALGTGCINEYQTDVHVGHIESVVEDVTWNNLPSESIIESQVNTCESSISFIQSNQHSFVSTDAPLEFSVQVDHAKEDQWVEWTDESGQIIAETGLMKDGSSHLRFSKGENYPSTVQATLRNPAGSCGLTIHQHVTVCNQVIDSLESSSDWQFLGDANHGDDGWVELTLNAQASQGAVFNPNVRIPDGSVSIRFTVQTGNGINHGADGLALTIIDIDDPSTLEALIASAPPGGGLGYGIGGPNEFWEGNALTIEVDTWPNVEEHEDYDPTTDSHIAIMRGADPSNHVIWSSVPDIEDFTPHDVQIDITPESMRILYDGEELARQRNPAAFTGGYVFLSGSTGWATNHHRVSDLEILHDCR